MCSQLNCGHLGRWFGASSNGPGGQPLSHKSKVFRGTVQHHAKEIENNSLFDGPRAGRVRARPKPIALHTPPSYCRAEKLATNMRLLFSVKRTSYNPPEIFCGETHATYAMPSPLNLSSSLARYCDAPPRNHSCTRVCAGGKFLYS